ncbi:MptD family putative ECF transporter S component [Rothia uropygialis]|uniref:MptD family putative ECF transporter S component n=1 Tax=Kocuria sp. 36 TaxID=1415402 RepID=UPI00101C35D1|nr:MptD family putative ECF transporter S component [Kocuria sp. 36]
MTEPTLGPSENADVVAVRPRSSVRYSAQDLVNVAIFAVVYFVIVFGIAMLGIISPVVMLVTLPLSAIAAGIPYMLFLTRVRHAGMVTLFGTVVALLLLMMGHPWQGTILTIVLSILADLVLAVGQYRSKWAAVWAYVVFSGWFAGPWIPFFIDPVGYFARPSMASMGEDYLGKFQEVVTVPAIGIMVAVTLVCGFLGALLGTRLLCKHFHKAGLA